MRVVVCQMIGHAGQTRVHVAATQIFGTDNFSDRCFDQRRTAQKDGALVFYDDGFIAHRRHIRTACGATAHDDRNLRNALRTHIGLVIEDAAKVLFVREHIVLVRQIRTA